MGEPAASTRRAITSEGLSAKAISACWTVAVILMISGITATFIAGTGAAPASMILFGSLFLVLALMKRMPLSLEVGGAKIDASYEVDEAFNAGRDAGIQEGVEVALEDVEKAEESGVDAHAALARRLERLSQTETLLALLRQAEAHEHSGHGPASGASVGYRGPTACNASGITHRQLDYWVRTGLISASARGGAHPLYTERDVLILKVIKRLLTAGISLQQIRTLVQQMQTRTVDQLAAVTLLSDGRSIYEATSNDEVIDLLGGGQGVFGIAIGGVLREVRKDLANLPAETITSYAPGGAEIF